jgi:preprotein translocase subunit Sec63
MKGGKVVVGPIMAMLAASFMASVKTAAALDVAFMMKRSLEQNFQVTHLLCIAFLSLVAVSYVPTAVHATSDELPKDYFQLFNQERGKPIDTRQVKKIYKKLSFKYHPDRNKEPDAQQNFIKINQAYEVMMDDKKRAIYERYGEEGLKGADNGEPAFRDPFDIFAQ